MSQKTLRVPLSTSAHDARSPLEGLARTRVAMNIRNLTSDSFESVIHIHFLKPKSLLLLFLIDFLSACLVLYFHNGSFVSIPNLIRNEL